MGSWIFVRLGMALVVMLAFALLIALNDFAKRVVRIIKRKAKESEQR